jgi:cell division septation protein DedD
VTQGPVQTEVTGPAAVPPAGHGAAQIALLPPEAPAPAQSTRTATSPAATTTAKPPAAPPVPTAAAAAAPVQTASSLPRTGAAGSYFLQLGAYGTEKTARDLAAKLAATYPALVLAPPSAGSPVFKVVIGPLNRAESGTLLTWFRYRGFPDAFLKQE